MNILKSLATAMLLLLSYPFIAQVQYATITRETSFKSEDDFESATLRRLDESTQVIYIGNCSRFYCQVEFEGEIGWIKKHLLEVEEVTESVEEEFTDSYVLEEESGVAEFEQEDIFQEETNIDGEATEEEKAVLTDIPTEQQTVTPTASSSDSFLSPWLGISLLAGLLLISILFFLRNRKLKRKIKQLNLKYEGIVDVDKEVKNRRKQVESEEANARKTLAELKQSEGALRSKHADAKKNYAKLMHEVNLLKTELDITEFGVYEPQFHFETSAIYKLKIKENRDKQRELIRQDKAAIGGESWLVNGNAASGRAMVKRQKKLMLRAFNAECDNFIKDVKWNNEKKMEEKILKSAEIITRLNEKKELKIAGEFVELKLLELRLAYEYELKAHEEQEIQREIRAKIRDEEKAIKEYERAKREATKEKRMLKNALKAAREQMESASTEEQAFYENRLQELEQKLKLAEEKSQRAISMTQQTQSGYIYVISNIGSFGENVYKIGMTRRLEPMDRVTELGNSSVPFGFDVHAMIYSENAPELENKLHAHFDKYRLNHINRRKEYFKVSLEEIEKVVQDNHGTIEFIVEAEAREYRESMVINEQLSNNNPRTKKVNGKALAGEFLAS
ncbi:MAG: DUF4041 domain-containing protein [Bacteroidota bacterium]